MKISFTLLNWGQCDVVKIILNSGINFENRERLLYEALIVAASAENEEITELLFRHGADVNFLMNPLSHPSSRPLISTAISTWRK